MEVAQCYQNGESYGNAKGERRHIADMQISSGSLPDSPGRDRRTRRAWTPRCVRQLHHLSKQPAEATLDGEL